jgi:PAS domain S-box-containing protein
MKNLSRAALEAIVKSIPAGVIFIEKETGKIIYANDHAIQLYGADPRKPELSNHSTTSMKLLTLNGGIYPPEQLPASKALQTGKEAKDDLMIKRSDGSLIVVSVSAVPLMNESGEVIAVVGILEDVTERKKAEDDLRKNEARYRSYIEVTGQLGWTTNAEGEVVEDMPSWRNFTGQTFEEIKGSGWSKALHPDDLENTLAVWKQATQEKMRCETEYRIRRRDGLYRDFMARGVPVFNTDGTIREWVGTCIDITDRKKAEEILREQATVISSVSDAIFSTDASFMIKSWNKAAERIFGWGAQEVIGKPWRTLFNPIYSTVDGTTREQTMEQLMKKGFWNGEVIYHKKDGSTIPVSVSAGSVKDKKGTTVGTVAVVHDISVRKKREEKLRENQNDLNRAQAVAKTGSWRMNVQHNVLLWSDENHKIFGIPQGTPLTYESFLSVVHPQDREYVDAKWKAALSGEPYDIEHRLIVDGKVKWVRERVEMEFGKNGILLGGFGTTQEITDLVEMREKLEFYSKNLEKLVEAKRKQLKDAERLAAIGATAGMVGHDIRNPLQAITSDVYLVKSDLALVPECAEKESIKESLEEIEMNVEYINKIVLDLQDYARPIKPVAQDIDLEVLCEEILFKDGVPENIDGFCKVEDEVKKTVADSGLLKRILCNLVNNAVQAMPNGGRLTVHAFLEKSETVIAVEDTGVGIPEEVKPCLFTPLFTTKSKGQGFGLAVVKRLTESLGGTVTFESELGKGTRFIIRLPPKN